MGHSQEGSGTVRPHAATTVVHKPIMKYATNTARERASDDTHGCQTKLVSPTESEGEQFLFHQHEM
jgi:hypothetical protein